MDRKLTSILRTTIYLILVAGYSTIICRAQSSSATLGGIVEDEKGAVVRGAIVSVADPARGLKRTVTTNENGSFAVLLLPPSTYTVTVDQAGFAPIEIQNLVLNVGDQKSLQIRLKIGQIGEAVEVTAEPALADESPAVATVVDQQFVENIPLNGRSLQSLINLAPGVVLTRTGALEQGQFSINGQRANANYFTVDGVSANIGSSSFGAPGQATSGSLPGLTAGGGTNNLVSVDALQEFKIQTSTYAPEFGRQPGGQIQILTRSGTNEFHALLFEYIRNEAFDANDWFANSRGLAKPPLRQNLFGGTLGGPIFLPRFGRGQDPVYDGRNKSFFFFSYEGLRLRQPQVTVVDVPSLDVRQVAPIALRPFLNAFPLPTGAARSNGYAEFAASYADKSSLNATSVRLDHTISDRFSIFGRFNYTPSDITQRTRSLSTVQTTNSDTLTLTGGAVYAFNAKVNNDLRLNYSRVSAGLAYKLDDFGGATPLPGTGIFPPGFSSEESVYFFSIADGLSTILSLGRNVEQLQRQINVADNLSVIVGDHQLKFGVDYRRLTPVYAPRGYVQQAEFNSIGVTAPGTPAPSGSVLSGGLSIAFISAQAEPREPVFTNLSLYGQDTWRAQKRLTLVYGLRYEVNPAPYERNGNDVFTVVGLDDLATAKLGPRGSLYETTYNNFAPRFGVAYQLSGESGRETVVRGGIGLFYDLGSGSIANGYSSGSFPYTANTIVPEGTIYPFVDPATAVPPPISLLPNNASLSLAAPGLKLPRVYQWNLSIEQSIGSNQTVTASYVAAVGRRLLRLERVVLSPGSNPNFGGSTNFSLTTNGGTSDYHALQLQFQRRLSLGLQALASYTFAKSLDIGSNDSGALAPEARYDAALDRGPSDFDVRHAFNGAVTYDFPRLKVKNLAGTILNGWSSDAIFTARSATPIDVFSNRNIGFGSFSLRPDLVSGQPLYVDDASVAGGRRFNRAAFAIPTALRQGDLGRNVLRGFPLWQLDLTVRRVFKLTERAKLQLRAEVFNLFNHPNFGNANGNLNVGSFGQSLSMLGRSLGSGFSGLGFQYQVGGPRSMQFGARLNF